MKIQAIVINVLVMRSTYKCLEFIISNWKEKFYIHAQNNFYLIAWIHLMEHNEEDKLISPSF